MLNARLGVELAHTLPAGLAQSAGHGPADIGPQVIPALPVDVRADIVSAYAQAVPTVFRYAVPVAVAAFLISWLLREIPLRATTHATNHTRELAAGSALAPATFVDAAT